VLEELITCKSGAPTPDGSRSSLTEMNISAISKTKTDVLMSVEAKMKKEEKLLSGRNMVVPTRDGRSSIKMKLRKFKRRDSMKTLAGIAADHSIWYQDFH
jgi:hypothetical protein